MPREIRRCADQHGNQAVRLADPGGEQRELCLRADQFEPVVDDVPEAAARRPALELLAAGERDRLDVVPEVDQPIAEVGFEAEPIEVDRDQRATDQMRDEGRQQRIHDRHPEHEPGDPELDASHLDGPVGGHAPEQPAERVERGRRREEREREAERARHVRADIVGDALIGVVESRGVQLGLAVGLGPHPLIDEAGCDALSPADLEAGSDVDAQRRGDDEPADDAQEDSHGCEERGRVAVPEGVEDLPLRVGDQHARVHRGELEGDRAEQQEGPERRVGRRPVDAREPPEIAREAGTEEAA
jgi:hypothetical protein